MHFIESTYRDIISKLNQKKDDRIPFVLYRQPLSNSIKFICQNDDKNNHLDDITNDKGFLINHFSKDKKPILIKADNLLCCYNIHKSNNEKKSLSANENDFDLEKKQYFELFDKAFDKIKNNYIDKIVISKYLDVKKNGLSYQDIFYNLINYYKDTFVYLLYHKDIGVWLGASPELLLESSDLDIKTVALAGTKNVNNYKHNKFWSHKEIMEHNFVVDYIMDVFSNIKFKDFVISAKKNYKLSNLVHIKTNFYSKLYDRKDIKLFLSLMHPSPAVSGYPNQKAIEFINDNEPYDRQIYTGFLGEINIDKTIKLFVNIRCLEVLDSHLRFYLGTGLTKDSNKNDEWNEIILKFKSIKNIIFD